MRQRKSSAKIKSRFFKVAVPVELGAAPEDELLCKAKKLKNRDQHEFLILRVPEDRFSLLSLLAHNLREDVFICQDDGFEVTAWIVD